MDDDFRTGDDNAGWRGGSGSAGRGRTCCSGVVRAAPFLGTVSQAAAAEL